MSNVQAHSELKGLQTRIAKAEGELQTYQEQRDENNQRIAELQRHLGELHQRMQAIKDASKELVVSEHAYCRYFERVLGYNLKDLAKQIVPDEVQQQIKALGGAGHFPVNGAYKLLVKNNVVTSVVGKDE